MMLKGTWRGQDKFASKVQRILHDMPNEVKTLTEKAVLYVHGQVPPYPAPPPDSTYQRTGTLGREITTEVRPVGSSFVGIIGTDTQYAKYVIDEKRQAWMHKGRWWTLQGVVVKAREAVVKIYADGVAALLNRS